MLRHLIEQILNYSNPITHLEIKKCLRGLNYTELNYKRQFITDKYNKYNYILEPYKNCFKTIEIYQTFLNENLIKEFIIVSNKFYKYVPIINNVFKIRYNLDVNLNDKLKVIELNFSRYPYNNGMSNYYDYKLSSYQISQKYLYNWLNCKTNVSIDSNVLNQVKTYNKTLHYFSKLRMYGFDYETVIKGKKPQIDNNYPVIIDIKNKKLKINEKLKNE